MPEVATASTEPEPGEVPEKHLNDVLESMELGYFHYRLLLMCGMSFMADAMEVSLLSFISTCAGVDWDLNDTEVAAITSVVFAGELLGSMFWGPFAVQRLSVPLLLYM